MGAEFPLVHPLITGQLDMVLKFLHIGTLDILHHGTSSWDNQTHIKDIMDNPARFPHGNSGSICLEITSATNTETVGLSNGRNPLDFFCKYLNGRSLQSMGELMGTSKVGDVGFENIVEMILKFINAERKDSASSVDTDNGNQRKPMQR